MNKPLVEVGATYNKKNRSLLISAFNTLKSALEGFLGDDETPEPDPKTTDKKDTKTKEVKGFSIGDLAAALGRELAEKIGTDAYIQDIFDDTSSVVYRKGWSGGYYQCSYDVDESGVATFGDPVEVSRKVQYVPTSDNEPPTKQPTPMYDESAVTTLESDAIKLIERAVSPNGTVKLKLISPGWGSSGFYSREVLQRDGPKVFVKGMHNYLDHPSQKEEQERPEGTVTKIGSVLTEDATWHDHFVDPKGLDHGPGLYAEAKVTPDFAGTLDVIGPEIGMSIRAAGKARVGEAEGKRGNIIEAITEGRSIDYVTVAGRGGKVLSLYESARKQTGDQDMASTEELKALEEKNAQLTTQVQSLLARLDLDQARTIVAHELARYPQLPNVLRERLAVALPSSYKLTESGTLDVDALKATVDTAVKAEMTMLAQLGVGHVSGMGGLGFRESASTETDPAKVWERIDQKLASF